MQEIHHAYCHFPGKKTEIVQINDLVKIVHWIKLTENPFCLSLFSQIVELSTLIQITTMLQFLMGKW